MLCIMVLKADLFQMIMECAILADELVVDATVERDHGLAVQRGRPVSMDKDVHIVRLVEQERIERLAPDELG
jgi:hypothetical protein